MPIEIDIPARRVHLAVCSIPGAASCGDERHKTVWRLRIQSGIGFLKAFAGVRVDGDLGWVTGAVRDLEHCLGKR